MLIYIYCCWIVLANPVSSDNTKWMNPYLCKRYNYKQSFEIMAKNTSILLRMFEHEKAKKTVLIRELKKGEKSGFVKNFDKERFLKSLHQEYIR